MITRFEGKGHGPCLLSSFGGGCESQIGMNSGSEQDREVENPCVYYCKSQETV